MLSQPMQTDYAPPQPSADSVREDYRQKRRLFWVRAGGFLLALLVIGGFYGPTLQDLVLWGRLKYTGEQATTTDFTFTFEPDKSASSPHYTLQFVFTPKDGSNAIEVEQDITTNDAIIALQEATSIEVAYLPDDPLTSAYIAHYPLPDFQFWVFAFLLLVATPMEIAYRFWQMLAARRALERLV